jgi:protein O-mannosyl-transferase
MAHPQRKKARLVAPSTTAPQSRSNLFVYVPLVIGVLAVFRSLFGYDFVDLDDFTYVVRNPHVVAGLTLKGIGWAFTQSYQGYWAPLTWLSYMADAQFWGLSAGAFHATNVVLHAASACVLFAALRRMTRAYWTSAFVAAIFAVHPLHVESVAWIAERKDVLSTFFCFLAIYAYVRYVERPGVARYVPVVAAFACGLMAKPMVVTLPVLLLLLDAWPLGRLRRQDGGRQIVFRLVAEKAPLIAMSLILGIVTIAAQSNAGATMSLAVAPPSLRAANAVVSCSVYLANMVWPAGLAALYPYPRTVPAWQVVGALLVLAPVTAVAVRLRHRAPYLLVGWLWYLVTLVPVLGFVQAGPQARADRYTYVAMIGMTMMVAWGAREISAGMRRQTVVLAVCGCMALVACTGGTIQQLTYWRNSTTLFRRALAVTTDNYVAHKGLGTALLNSGSNDEAIGELRAALAIAPDWAEAHSDLGLALRRSNRMDEAVAHLERAVQLRPDDMLSRVDLGAGYLAQGRSREAEAEFRQAVRLAPDSYEAQRALGLALAQQGGLEGARRAFEAAVHLNADYVDGYMNLGTVLGRMGLADEAARAFSAVIRLRPDSAEGYIGLATALAIQGRSSEAVEQLSIAVRLRPDDAELHGKLGITLIEAGRREEGIARLAEAVRMRPDLSELRDDLELARSMEQTRSARRDSLPAPRRGPSP